MNQIWQLLEHNSCSLEAPKRQGSWITGQDLFSGLGSNANGLFLVSFKTGRAGPQTLFCFVFLFFYITNCKFVKYDYKIYVIISDNKSIIRFKNPFLIISSCLIRFSFQVNFVPFPFDFSKVNGSKSPHLYHTILVLVFFNGF